MVAISRTKKRSTRGKKGPPTSHIKKSSKTKQHKINVKGVSYKMPASKFLKQASKLGINVKKGQRIKSR